jgi:RNA polymerase sigma-70 factor, ECF subfamily
MGGRAGRAPGEENPWLRRVQAVEWCASEVEHLVDTTRPSLLLRIRDRSDAAAWRTFDALYRPMLERFARARGLAPAEAEEVAQQCLTQISAQIDGFAYDPAKGHFKSWLRTLVNNRVRNALRDRHEQQGGSAAFVNLPATEPTAEEVFERIWMEELLWQCLRELRGEVEDTTFRAFQGYVIEQRPLEDICAELHLRPQNVYTIKWRLTERVAAKMRELLDGAE